MDLIQSRFVDYPTYTLKYYNDLYCVRFTLLRTKTTISVGKKKNGTANPHPPPPPPTPLKSDEAAQRAKTRHFPLFDIGGGEV